MPRLALFRLPTRLHRRVRRNRMATLVALATLALALVLPVYAAYCVYKPPEYVMARLRARYPDVLFEVPMAAAATAGAAAEKLVALSLDDAPSRHTADIVEALRENDARATFFVIGAQAEGREEALRRLVRDGHELANHAMHDEASRGLTDEQLERDVDQVRAKLVAAYEAEGGVLPNNYFRPGSGLFSRRMRDLLGSRGYRIVLGSVYPHDAQMPYPSLNARHVLSMARPGAIIVCHDRRPWTAPMLRIVLPELRRRGYRVVTVTDLVKAAEPLGGR